MVGVLDDLRAAYGDNLGAPPPTVRDRSNWTELCVCGHIAKHHPSTIGGPWTVAGPAAQTIRGEEITVVRVAENCRGAMPSRTFETETMAMDREAMVMTVTYHGTCPCDEWRPIARVDRPNRYFNQRVYLDRHPFATGTRALLTHLSKRKPALTDPDWPEVEFARRLVWIEEARRCSITGCRATGGDVLPAYVSDVPDTPGYRVSAMRCSAHRADG